MTTRQLTLVLFCLLVSVAGLQGQFETATVLGTVKDPSGAVLPNGSVTLENLNTGLKETIQTNSEGNYTFLTVKIGRYQVRVAAQGFRPALSEPFEVAVGARQRVDMMVQVGGTTESVMVTGTAAALETDSSDRGHVVRTTEIEALPLNGRAYADLVLLAPGVRRSMIADSRDASFNVNGQRSSLNSFTIDGVDNNSYANSNQGFSNQVIQASPDALAEFKVQVNNYSAEYGRASGAVVNASLKSGTNEFHGALWEFLRNTNLNAVGFFKPSNGKPTLSQNQFGFTLGGPIVRNRTFFFIDYEGFRAISHSLSWQTLPTRDQVNGRMGVAVYNAISKTPYPDGVIPVTDMSRFGRKVALDMPAPNLPGTVLNYQWLPRAQSFNDKGDVKLDHRFNDKFSMFARLSQRKVNNYAPPSTEGPSGSGNNAWVRTLNQAGVLGATWLLDARSLFEFRLGVTRTVAGKSPDGVGGPNMMDLYGIPGVPTDPRFAGGLYSVSLNTYPSPGRQSSNPQSQNPFVKNPKLNYSRFFGQHTVKAGYEYQAVNLQVDDFNPKYGQDSYTSQYSRPSGVASNYLYTLSDLLLGYRASYSMSTATPQNVRQRMHFGYVQDDWKVTSRLTLNLGLRYEYGTPQYERDNRQANFDPSTGGMILARDGSLFDRTMVHPDRNNFAPRFGYAYQFRNQLVLRGGYGISYVHFNRLGGESVLAYNWPYEFSSRVATAVTLPTCGNDLNPATCFRPPEMGYPAGFLSTSISTLVNQSYIYYTPPNLRSGYVQNWHFTVQRQLPLSMVLDVAYVGSKGTRLMILGDRNQSPRPGVSKPFPTLQNIEQSFDGGFSNYNGLQVKLERRFSGGLYFLESFTFSKAIDNAAGHLEVQGGDNSRVNMYGLGQEKGISSYNQPFNSTTTVVWRVPYGKGQKWGSGLMPVLDGVFGGWGLSTINTMTSGQPFTLRYNPTGTLAVSGLPSYRPDVIADPLAPEATRNPNMYLNKAALAIPADWPFGSAARNMLRGYALYNLDASLQKSFRLPGENRRLEFRAEAFNALNKTNFNVPDGNMSNATFGRITTTFSPRVLQFGLKLYY